ncbi:hypothetical protein H5410_037060 [Solanum commersonii]|uniref:Uncharacterized protein n=1 Tax=Solanum commersonii TaxID=4109 RepID=A0A9J5Y965_SOLCO|nr:hypothetical protein H5410_037060 [Solanum commersonii]
MMVCLLMRSGVCLTEGRGPTQPHLVPSSTPMLRELIVMLLARLDSAPTSGIHPGITISSTLPV